MTVIKTYKTSKGLTVKMIDLVICGSDWRDHPNGQNVNAISVSDVLEFQEIPKIVGTPEFQEAVEEANAQNWTND